MRVNDLPVLPVAIDVLVRETSLVEGVDDDADNSQEQEILHALPAFGRILVGVAGATVVVVVGGLLLA